MRSVLSFVLLLVVVCSSDAQVTARRLVRPLTKEGVIPPPRATPPRAIPADPVAAKPATPAIEPDLKPSPISLLGKIDGLAGTLYVTNIGKKALAPYYQIAVLDKGGKTVGWVTNTVAELQPKESEKIQVLATNANAVDLKLMKLIGRK
jgi:hypothetical protein